MKKIAIIFAVVFLCTTLSTSAFCGPFGTEMGDSIEKYPQCAEGNKGDCTTTEMPKQHSSFNKYILSFGGSGLYQILGVTDDFISDAFGTYAKREYAKLKQQLTEKYGSPSCVEALRHGSIWKDDREFMMSIFKKERDIVCEWDNKGLPDNLMLIRLLIFAKNSSNGNVLLLYRYKNFVEIEIEKENNEKNSL